MTKESKNDHVYCHNCETEQIVRYGENKCLKCGEKGYLEWATGLGFDKLKESVDNNGWSVFLEPQILSNKQRRKTMKTKIVTVSNLDELIEKADNFYFGMGQYVRDDYNPENFKTDKEKKFILKYYKNGFSFEPIYNLEFDDSLDIKYKNNDEFNTEDIELPDSLKDHNNGKDNIEIEPSHFNLKLNREQLKELNNILEYALANMLTSDCKEEIPDETKRICKEILSVLRQP